MPPNKRIGNTLVYENDDVDLISSFQKKGYRTVPIFYVNGKLVPSHKSSQAKPNQTLLSFLRDVLHLTGTKLGCAEGGCGACSVMISRQSAVKDDDTIHHYAVNACLMPVLAADGCHITTVEGIGTANNLHPIQKAMVDMHGSQCGFCTPGIIVAIYSLFANNTKREYIEEHLDGNLCRCTGYRPIWDAARSLCSSSSNHENEVVTGPCGVACSECPERNTCEMDCNVQDRQKQQQTTSSAQKTCCSSSEDKIKKFTKNHGENETEDWWKQPETLFPNELRGQNEEIQKPLVVVDNTYHIAGTWFKPTSMKDLLYLLKQFEGECKIVVGNTEVGIETKFKHSVMTRLIYPSPSIDNLYDFQLSSHSLNIGSCTSLQTIQSTIEKLVETEKSITHNISRTIKPIHDMLRWFASTQIRNVACLGGNLVTASPISDMNPMLACLGAKMNLSSYVDINGCNGINSNDNEKIHKRQVAVADFFKSYRVVDLKPFELVDSIDIPLVQDVFEYVMPFKQARRREDDISIVTSTMRVRLKPTKDAYLISDVSLAFGGMAPVTILAKKTSQYLIGKEFGSDIFSKAKKALQDELKLPEEVPGGQAEYRMALATSFLFKFFIYVTTELENDITIIQANESMREKYPFVLPPIEPIGARDMSALDNFVCDDKPSLKGVQKYPHPRTAKGLEQGGEMKTATKSKEIMLPKKQKSVMNVGKVTPHASAPLHCTGEAIYCDDIPLPPESLHATLIMAKRCNVKLVSINTATALDTPGVVAVYTHEDLSKINGDNSLGPIVHDEYAFLPCGEVIPFVGQVLGICVGTSLECSEAGARSTEIEYEENDETVTVSIEDAIANESFYDFARHTMERGDVSKAFDTTKNKKIVSVEGSFRCGGQEHFYLETNSTLVIPSESATNLTVYASTQAPTKTQMYCASATNTPASKVVVRMKRMGGGFGGKETRSVFASCAAAVAAKLTNRPVRLTLGRDVDMGITGGRHAFLANYRASAEISSDGKAKLHGMDVQLYSNGGSAFDLSGPVMDRALFHVDGPYHWPHFRAVGVPCKTVQPPHTAFRGFGGPQGLATCEHIIDHLATACNVSAHQLRNDNLYKDGDSTPFGMIIGEKFSGKWNVPTMWNKLEGELDIPSKRAQFEEFNSKHKWKKRGLAMVPTKFGIAFTAKFMNQGGALVHVYTDGTILVTHGGTEMGQGLHTKVCQIAAQAFGIPLEDVYVNDTSTDKVANTIPTAASMSTDLYGMATLDACKKIIKRLDPYRAKFGENANLKDVAKAAHFDRVDLSAHGFYALDDDRCGYDWAKEKPDDYTNDAPENSWKGHPFNYFTQGVAYCEVEIDVLTGNHKTLRSDVLVDVGASINPMIDIGQIEGAYIQGMGWSTLEEVIYSDKDHKWIRPTGTVFTRGPGTYKIPGFNDVPEIFNVELMRDVDNPFAVHSSKAVGEPPFFLGTSVFYAVKDAIKAARKESGVGGYYELRMPATSERIRMACGDLICKESIETVRETALNCESFQPKGSF